MEDAPGTDKVKFRCIKLEPEYQDKLRHIDVRTPLQIHIEFWNNIPNADLNLSLHLFTVTGECVFNVATTPQSFAMGLVAASLEIPGNFLNDEAYVISIMIVKDTSTVLYQMPDALSFEVEDYREIASAWHGKWPECVKPEEATR